MHPHYPPAGPGFTADALTDLLIDELVQQAVQLSVIGVSGGGTQQPLVPPAGG